MLLRQSKVGHTLPRIETQLNNGLNCFLLKIDVRVDLNAVIVHPLFYPCEEMAMISVDIFALGGIEELPKVWEVVVIVTPVKPIRAVVSSLVYPLVSLIGMGPFVVGP